MREKLPRKNNALSKIAKNSRYFYTYVKKKTNINEDLMDKETKTDPSNEIIYIMEEDIANNSEDHTRESDIRNRNRQITNINTHKNEE